MLSAFLLTLAFAPLSQCYFAWVGLVPVLLFVRRAATTRRLFLWSWAAGTVFFALNIWWLGFVTVPGTMGSVLYMGVYWGLAAVILRGAGVLGEWWSGGVVGWWSKAKTDDAAATPSPHYPITQRLLAPFAIAAVWTGCEWVRGNLGTGWPWSFLGYTQTPVLAMCQVADVVGVHGVTFWVVAVNAVVAALVVASFRVRPVAAPMVAVGAMLVAVLVYGIVRMAQTETTPGPRVMVVQANFPQSNTGNKGASREELVSFHLEATRDALAAEVAAGRRVDLVAWSETMMPNLNPKARATARGTDYGLFLEDVYQALASMCFDYRTALITGGEYAGDLRIHEDRWIDLDRRNAAYFFEPTGTMSDLRYDKVHLVPFGEYVPFKETIPPLYRFFMWFSPYEFDYNLVPGGDDQLTVFTLRNDLQATSQPSTASITAPAADAATTQPATEPYDLDEDAGARMGPRFVVPICFEDADPRLVARMFDGGWNKRADFIVNITNDGWFSQPQLSQHLQIARFRSIENRAPTARSVNTGISAFIDSVGRVYDRLPAHVEGTLTSTLPLDARYTIYSRIGDAFAVVCTGVTALLAGWGWLRARRARRGVAPE